MGRPSAGTSAPVEKPLPSTSGKPGRGLILALASELCGLEPVPSPLWASVKWGNWTGWSQRYLPFLSHMIIVLDTWAKLGKIQLWGSLFNWIMSCSLVVESQNPNLVVHEHSKSPQNIVLATFKGAPVPEVMDSCPCYSMTEQGQDMPKLYLISSEISQSQTDKYRIISLRLESNEQIEPPSKIETDS